jgi:hypothetical protein
MENYKLRVLLSKSDEPLENEGLSDDTFVSINESVALRLRATYGGLVNSTTCSNNTGCGNNNVCSGNNGCYNNSTCN